jgi:flagellar biogenesis protein FliO
MSEALLGPEMPFAIRFSLAFLISLGLISATVGMATWGVRRFRTGSWGGASTRAREPRLAVVARISVDESRQLILVRRDNVEHLLMIGWRTDVIIDANIAHAGSAPHEVVAARTPAAAEPLPSGIPLPDKGSWPPQREPIGAEHASRSESSLQTKPTATGATSTADETLAALMERIETALR